MNEDEKSEHVAWLRYETRHERVTRIILCDSDADGAFPVFRQPHNAELEKLRARMDSAPVAIMDTRDVLGICAPTEDDFPALYALRGKRVRLVVEDELHALGDRAKQGTKAPNTDAEDKIYVLRQYIDALHGKGNVRHTYSGRCPDETQPDSRDNECPACRLLLTPNAPHEGRTAALSPGVPLDAVVGAHGTTEE